MPRHNDPAGLSRAERFLLNAVRGGETEQSFLQATAEGLAARPRSLPCRFFYDERGSKLFEEITQLPEYYPTRVERGILEERAHEIAATFDEPTELIELGSGSAAKTRQLIRELIERHGSLCFRPIDISPSILESSSRALLADYPELTVRALAGEYEAGLREIERAGSSRPRLFLWLGSSIGNLTRDEACAFLQRLRETLRPQDRLLVGIDRRKAPATLIAAYDDAAGITAEFNQNLLLRANRELGADFDLAQFQHRAVWLEEPGRIEMHLVSLRQQRVRVEALDAAFDFDAGETLHTENSHKYSPAEIDDLAERSGLVRTQSWQDAASMFELSMFQTEADA